MKKLISCVAIVTLFVFIFTLCCCGETEYKVTFDSDGGTYCAVQTVKSGERASKPKNPTKAPSGQKQYTFIGWYLGEEPFDFDTPITGDTTLTAKYKEEDFTPFYPPDETAYYVSFETGSSTVIQTQRVVEGRKATEPQTIPIKPEDNEGVYVFDCWYLDDEPYDFNTPVTESIFLTAHYTVTPKFSVTFDTVGGNKISTQYVLTGNTATKPTDPVKPDDARKTYTFKEWQLNGVTFDFNTTITENITLTAVYDEDIAFTPEYPPQDL